MDPQKIVRAVTEVLQERERASGTPPRTTVGTAGKVFSGEPGAWPSSPPVGKKDCGCGPVPSVRELARRIDHTLLKPDAAKADVEKLCDEARRHHLFSVCVNPVWVPFCRERLADSPVKICTVIGFPLGASRSLVKAVETRDAVAAGADEIDMVLAVGLLKSGDLAGAMDDLRAVRSAAEGRVLKVILETTLLSRDEKVTACLLAKDAGADFVKTSTGFAASGATAEDVKLMRQTVGPAMGVKAAGGIRTLQQAREMIAAGASRIGTSASVALVSGDCGCGGSGGEKAY
jgi:deoxyribose-phosphate aldolase